MLDKSKEFQSSEFCSLLNTANVQRKDAGVESHSSLGETERYHPYLRHVSENVCIQHPEMSDKVTLQLASKACNDTAGPQDIVPTLLVFGVLPRMPLHPKELPDQRDRMSAVHSARSHMAKLTARTRMSTAVNLQVPAAADADLIICDPLLLYGDNPVDHWTDPFRAIDLDGRPVR